MTKKQEQIIERIRQEVLKDFCHNNDSKYEIKTWEVEENKYFVSLYVVCGLKDDEGTLAEVFARDRIHVFIGPRGGIKYPTDKNTTKRLTSLNLWEVLVAQKY